MLSILNFVLKTHPPGPMLIATKSWPGATWPRVIELWGGASTPCFPVHTGAGGVRLCGLEIHCEVHQVVEHPLCILGLVAIGTQAVLSLCIHESL